MILIKANKEFKVCKLRKGSMDASTYLKLEKHLFAIISEQHCITCIVEEGSTEEIDMLSSEQGWVSYQVEGQLSFELSGVLVSLISPLSESDISVLVTSSFDTDYIFVKQENTAKAESSWKKSGVKIRNQEKN
ncbi:ACT domain-containing protein [Pseudoalteromonas rubra]|uniref:CASTOR ACT domain-containing protein n=1 Tax=Pseudoalteromonas rubra TaxID=43658 RepID=A0A5S3WWP4_9GAMM|nr:ACT domain-containing protein [Pseudoalteromonas rubra]TMP34747.1 hypothetical protein CWB98_17270 [Pseudoalteromonas rubra]